MQVSLQGRAVPSTSGRSSQPVLKNVSLGRRVVRVEARASRYDRRKPPPPDLPSLLFDQRIVFLGMPVSGGALWEEAWRSI